VSCCLCWLYSKVVYPSAIFALQTYTSHKAAVHATIITLSSHAINIRLVGKMQKGIELTPYDKYYTDFDARRDWSKDDTDRKKRDMT